MVGFLINGFFALLLWLIAISYMLWEKQQTKKRIESEKIQTIHVSEEEIKSEIQKKHREEKKRKPKVSIETQREVIIQNGN